MYSYQCLTSIQKFPTGIITFTNLKTVLDSQHQTQTNLYTFLHFTAPIKRLLTRTHLVFELGQHWLQPELELVTALTGGQQVLAPVITVRVEHQLPPVTALRRLHLKLLFL